MGKRQARQAPPEDLWETEGDEYSPNEFYCAGADRRGHSETVYVRVPTYVASGIMQIIQSGKVPYYKTIQDFIRDAIAHRLHYIMREWAGELDEVCRILRIRQQVAKIKEADTAFKQLLEDLQQLATQGRQPIVLERLRELLEITEDRILREQMLTLARTLFPDQPWPSV